MALLYIDGFDAYGVDNTNVVAAMFAAGYASALGFGGDSHTAASASTRTGIGFSIFPSGISFGGGILRNFQTASGIVSGFAVKVNQGGTQALCRIGYNNYAGGAGMHLIMSANGANGITVATADGAHFYSSAPNVLFESVWQYIEIKYSPGVGASYLEVRVDGIAVIVITNQALVSGTLASLVNMFEFSSNGNSNIQVDDWYLCDLTGASFNNFLGDCVVHALLPNADGGTNQFTQTGGTGGGHFTSVEEVTPDGDASYLSSNTTGQIELFTVPTLPADIVDVLAVAVNISARKQAAGIGTYASILDVGGVQSVSAAIPTSLGYVTQQRLFASPPGGGAWTLTAAQNAKFGVKIV